MRSSRQRWLDAVSSLHTWKRGDERAPHNPLLTLLLLARAARGGSNQVLFSDVEEKLTRLLQEFGPRRDRCHPENPFWHLQTDGFWVVQDADQLPLKKGGSSPSRKTLQQHQTVGYVPEDLWQVLEQDPRLVWDLSEHILEDFWPESQHSGQLIPDAGYFWDHAEQRYKIAQDYLFASYVCPGGKHYPLDFRRFCSEKLCAELQKTFGSHTHLCLQLIDWVCAQ